jgi:hypothetical protein
VQCVELQTEYAVLVRHAISDAVRYALQRPIVSFQEPAESPVDRSEMHPCSQFAGVPGCGYRRTVVEFTAVALYRSL